MKKQLKDALILGFMQFLSWGISTISWRAVAQANIPASVMTDFSLATVNFFVIKNLAKNRDDSSFIPWLGYSIGGVLGTVTGIFASIFLLGK